jgi:hypothetical protein
MPEDLNVYAAFWETLVPQSNRRTGFSIRGARKRDFISYQLVGFQFSYHLDWLKPQPGSSRIRVLRVGVPRELSR